MKISLIILTITFSILSSLVFCQTPSPLPVCVPNATPAPGNLPFPTISNTAQVQLNIERLNPILPIAEEITEYFDGRNNYGIARQLVNRNYVRSYSYYSTNELILVKDDKCKVLKLNESSDDTPFSVTVIDGVEHIISPLSVLINNSTFKFVYIGEDFPVRGIKVNKWQACAYSDSEKKSYNIDPSQWAPAATTAAIPVEVVIETTSSDGTKKTDYNTITQFRPFILLEEEDYFTGPGIYCEGKSPGKPVPTMPDSFSFIIQETQPIPGTNPPNLAGTIGYGYEEYNYKYKLFRHDYISRGNIRTTEIHDFITGLNYKFDRNSGNCTVTKLVNSDIDSEVVDGQLVFRNPNQFFDFENVPFQYVDVWIGPKKINGLDCLLEWYFLADQWNRTDLPGKNKYSIPIELRIYTDLSSSNLKVTSINRYQVTNFLKRDFHPSDFDISICERTLSKRFFRFSLSADLTNDIKAGLIDFKAVVATMLQSEARVSILRLSRFEVVFDDDAVYVLFTLFERTDTYGVSVPPVDDLKSEDAIKLLNASFIAGRILIEFKTIDDEFIIPTLTDSFEEIGNYEEGFITIRKELVTGGFTGETVAIVTIVITLVGLMIGIFVTILQKNKKINLPFLNKF